MSDEILNQHSSERTDGGGILEILSRLMPKDSPTAQTAERPLADSGILSSLLQSPEILGKLPELMSVISPLLGNLSTMNDNGTEAVKSLQKSPQTHQNHEAQNRAALLCALKPYLKKERRDAIDYMIKLSRLGDILKTL